MVFGIWYSASPLNNRVRWYGYAETSFGTKFLRSSTSYPKKGRTKKNGERRMVVGAEHAMCEVGKTSPF